MRLLPTLVTLSLIFLAARAKDEKSLEVPLDALIPNRLLSQMNDGWRRSMGVLKMKDVLALPKIFARRAEMTSLAEAQAVIKAESPMLNKVLVSTVESWKRKIKEKVGKLSEETKTFGQQVHYSVKGFIKQSIVKRYNSASPQVQQEIETNFPFETILIKGVEALLEQDAGKQAANKRAGKRAKRAADYPDAE